MLALTFSINTVVADTPPAKFSSLTIGLIKSSILVSLVN